MCTNFFFLFFLKWVIFRNVSKGVTLKVRGKKKIYKQLRKKEKEEKKKYRRVNKESQITYQPIIHHSIPDNPVQID